MFTLKKFARRMAQVACLLASVTNAHAITTCPGGAVPQSFVGDFGATAVVFDCFSPVGEGGAGVRSARASLGGTSATADLTVGSPNPGVLTVFAVGDGRADAALWDTIHFYIPHPDGSAPTVTLTLSLEGSITGDGYAWVSLFPEFAPAVVLTSSNFPSEITETFLLNPSVPLVIGAVMSVNANGGTVDLVDPPTLTVAFSDGVTYTSASGAYTSAVPEPSSPMLAMGGLCGLWLAARRRSLSRAARA